MTPNQITAARVAAAFAAVALFTFFDRTLAADLAAVGLTITAIALDGVDGHLARSRGLASPLGAQIDILGDRIVENLFFTFFAVTGLVSMWVPILFFVRGTLTDFLRGVAARLGRPTLDGGGTLEKGWARALVASRASRASYATLKCACFSYLGLMLHLRAWPDAWPGPQLQPQLFAVADLLVACAALFCLVRAIPVFWNARRCLAAFDKGTRTGVVPVAR